MADDFNLDAIAGYLDGLVSSFDFTRRGAEGSLGRDLAMTVIRGPDTGETGGIMGRIAEGVGPDGTPWPENAPEYAAAKEKAYGWSEPNRRVGQMTSFVSLYGRTTIAPDEVVLRYGTGEPPDSSAAPSGHMSDADRARTDVEKAAYAHAGQSRKGIKRPFYGVGQGDPENVAKVAQDNLNEMIKEHNSGHGT